MEWSTLSQTFFVPLEVQVVGFFVTIAKLVLEWALILENNNASTSEFYW